MWSIPGKSVPVTRFPRFEPDEVFYEFDGPRIFSLRDSEGELNLAYWSDDDDAICRYVVVPTTANILQACGREKSAFTTASISPGVGFAT